MFVTVEEEEKQAREAEVGKKLKLRFLPNRFA